MRTKPSQAKDDQILERFKSISNRPKNVSCPAQDRICAVVVDRRKQYGFEGANRIKGILKLSESTSTINKVLRKEGLMSKPKKRHHNLSYGPYERAVEWYTKAAEQGHYESSKTGL